MKKMIYILIKKAAKIQKDYTNLNVLESNLEINLKEIQDIPKDGLIFYVEKLLTDLLFLN